MKKGMKRRVNLLADYTTVVNKYGPDSKEEKAFRAKHLDKTGFQKLAQTVRDLKKAISVFGWPTD